eukprot:Selendium_serpulae@DN627_c0_g1_i1.p2
MATDGDGFTKLGKKTYLLRSKAWSLSSGYYIKDENNEDVYSVKKHFSLVHDKLTLLDKSEVSKLDIFQKFNWFTARYTITRQGEPFAQFLEKCVLCGSKYQMTCSDDRCYHVEGNIWDREYVFERDGSEVASVSKARFSLTDSYGVQIDDDEDQELILAAVAIIDRIRSRKKED